MNERVAAFVAQVTDVETRTDPVTLNAYGHDVSPMALKQASRGRAMAAPHVVAFPNDASQVVQCVLAARQLELPVTPFGGGSGVVGGALALHGGVTIELKRLAGISNIDRESLLVTVGAGTNGQRLEDALRVHELTTGHYPQSLRSSTVGGWLAHRAVGTASTRYGGIEDLVGGLQAVLPDGSILDIPANPRSSTGPDLKQLFLGSEGIFGIVTQVTLRVRSLPQERSWLSYAPADFQTGLAIVRRILQADLRPAIVRLYDETEANELFPSDEERCLLLFGIEGFARHVPWLTQEIRHMCGSTPIGPDDLGSRWWQKRFNTSGLLEPIVSENGIGDALEVSAPWSNIGRVYDSMRRAMDSTLNSSGDGEVFGHLSHAYRDGANLYMIFRGYADDATRVQNYYDAVLEAAFTACVEEGGAISHHHGIGSVKAPWLPLQHGETGMALIRQIRDALDPGQLFCRSNLTGST